MSAKQKALIESVVAALRKRGYTEETARAYLATLTPREVRAVAVSVRQP